MKYGIKNSYPNKLICVCIIHSTDICVTQLWWPHCNYNLKKIVHGKTDKYYYYIKLYSATVELNNKYRV